MKEYVVSWLMSGRQSALDSATHVAGKPLTEHREKLSYNFLFPESLWTVNFSRYCSLLYSSLWLFLLLSVVIELVHV